MPKATDISRRRFAELTGTAILAGRSATGQPKTVTAQQVIERIQKNIGVPWRPDSLDTFKAGDPAAPLTGIATTAMATMDVLSRAVKEKANLVITLEPTYFGRPDGMPAAAAAGRGQNGVSPDDPVYIAKKEFIRKNGLVIWRFTDHWRTRTPDPFAIGLAQTMAWSKYQVKDDPFRYNLPNATLGSLADELAKRLKARAGIRVVGDPQTKVRSLTFLPGVSTLAATMKALPECDAVLAGETREWESVEYAHDTVASGQKKGLIMLGRVLSEDPGMNVCAEWLKSMVPEVPVRWLSAGDAYWRPA
jgi:putative NIF3 family GTP cyclohydrolase 1 type 2